MGFFEVFTSGHGWIYAAFCSTVISAFMMLVNQIFKQNGGPMVLLFRFFVFASLLPFTFLVAPPESWKFYAAIAAAALSGGIADIRILNITAKYGGGMASRLNPLAIFTTFPIWFFFDNDLLQNYIQNPLKSAGIIATLIGGVYFSSRFRKCEINKNAIIDYLPCLFGYTIASIAAKIAATQGGDRNSILLFYMFGQSLFLIPIVSLYMAVFDKKSLALAKIFNKQVLLAAFAFAFFWMASMLFRVTSLMTVPNPAYITVIGLLTPVIIAMIYRIVKHKEDGDVASGFGIVLCAMLMSLLTI